MAKNKGMARLALNGLWYIISKLWIPLEIPYVMNLLKNSENEIEFKI